MRRIIFAGGLSLILMGCNSDFLKIDPGFAAPLVEQGAAMTTTLGLKALVKNVEALPAMKETVKTVSEALTTSVIPLVGGADLNTITKATADKALALLSEKIPIEYRGVIQMAVNGALTLLKLPDNPMAKLEKGQVDVILAVFNGIKRGFDNFLAWFPGNKAMEDIPVIMELTWTGGKGP